MSANEYVIINGVRYAAMALVGSNDDGSISTDLVTAIAGERLVSSETNSYMVTKDENNCTILNTVSTAVTLGGGVAGDASLTAVLFTADLAGNFVIGGFERDTGTALDVTFLAGTLAGYYPFYGAINSAGALDIKIANAGDVNKKMAFWRPRV